MSVSSGSGHQGEEKVDVVGVGTSCVDLVFMVEKPPITGGCMIAENFLLTQGGIVGNFLVGCSRLGLKARFIGKLGRDHFGSSVLEELKKEEVDVSAVVFDEKEPTEIVVVLLEKSGERSFVVNIGATNKLKFNEVNLSKALSCRVLYSDGVPFEAVSKLFAEAKRRSIFTALDLAAELKVYEKISAPRDEFLKLLEHVDVVFPSLNFLEDLYPGYNLREACMKLLNYGPKVVAATLGARGSIVADSYECSEIPSFAVQVVDTTGAGDAYRAAFIYAFLKGFELKDCGIIASAAAALNCQRVGARAGMPTLDELKAFLVEKGFNRIAERLG